ncbi:phosphotransferase family protein [Amycolatopsis thermoflava]|uniref:phosphotransferase family protein n=1 Tax=Amycolatopsis thermoflava TaxID=84480 RepID=UPI0004220FBC|nr:phosphotransferase family protein [Amycolatopsis thermoflava]
MASQPLQDHAEAIDLGLVSRLFREAGIEPAGPLRADLLSGGRSNLTFVLTDGASEWVLRRPPLGHVLATAHDMDREARVQRALGRAGFPVPRVVVTSADPSFYVMARVPGTVLRTDADLAAVPVARRRALGEAYVDALAALHAVDPGAVGLGDFGRPAGFAGRQVARWSKQLAGSRSRDLPGLDELATRLANAVPADQRGAVVHGDFRLDNMIFDLSGAPELRAVLDWEMSTLGDPLTDLGLVWLFWEGWRGIDNPIAGTAGTHEGYPSWGELAQRYRRRSDLRLDDFAWYQAFACFKLAVILEGIHYRHAQGLTVGEGFASIGDMVEPLVSRGLDLV